MIKSNREKFLKKAKEQTKLALGSRDLVLSHISRSIDDINKAANLMGERLEEWFGIYVPEFKMEDRKKHAEIILTVKKDGVDAKALSKIVGSGKANQISNSVSKGFGGEINEADFEECKSLAQSILDLYALREKYENYIEKLCMEMCPNIANLAGSDVAAKLIAHVGSLSRLAVLPSSTIQVLGAERALFKHLKNKRIDPPKHGIIFLHVSISASPKKVRGKVARALANHLAIAAKADYFTKNTVWPELKKDFEDRFKQIMEEYQKEKTKVE
ncbi:hypothetical protein HYT84_01660 [Candidatus Micrarchaeota archaeon]|nr:hypothetical protein [Candidatus Micrarchaeota archaeon]